MRPIDLLVIYALLGVAVAAALRWRGHPGAWVALVAWPLQLPVLWAPRGVGPPPAALPLGARGRIDAAVAGLSAALSAWAELPGGAAPADAAESARRGLLALAERAAQLEAVVAALPAPGPGASAGRAAHHEDLVALRDAASARLEGALEAVAALTTRAHLARFQGDADGDLAEVLDRLAQAVDSAGEVSRLGADGGAGRGGAAG